MSESECRDNISLTELAEMEEIARLLQKVWPDIPSIGDLQDAEKAPSALQLGSPRELTK